MMREHRLSMSLIILASLVFAVRGAAEELILELDPGQTYVDFGFGATLHSVAGKLRCQEGTVRVNPETGTASGRIVLDASSAETGNARRDRKMHQKILESARFPKIIFEIERMSGALHRTGRSELQLHGDLEFHGVRRPVAMPVVATAEGDWVTARGSLTVPYLEWGLPDPSFFILRVQKQVDVAVKTAGRLTPAPPAPAASAASPPP